MGKITIGLTRHKEPNWLLNETLRSLSLQRDVKAEVLVADQFYDKETEGYCRSLTTAELVFKYIVIPEKGLSYARNYVIKHCATHILLFTDADAVPDVNWAAELSTSLSRTNVGVAGGKITAKWYKPPLFITKANLIREQYSLLDLGDEESTTRKVIGANFGLHLGRLKDVAYFDVRLGRNNGNLMGGEETDLCMRVDEQGMDVYYNGRAIVYHQILPERVSYRWIVMRLYSAGFARAMRGGKLAPTHSKSFWDYLFMPFILAPYALGYFRMKFFGGQAGCAER